MDTNNPPFDPSIQNNLRKMVRLKRNTLSVTVQQHKSQQIMRRFVKHPFFLHSKAIAAYWPVAGEVDPRFILEQAFKRQKTCYLPLLHPLKPKTLLFAEYKSGDALIQNRYNILEPSLSLRQSIPPEMIDVVLIPVVAFDEAGRRLGSGGGYYDRSFAFLKQKNVVLTEGTKASDGTKETKDIKTSGWEPYVEVQNPPLHRPKLIGLAYEFQKTAGLIQKPWDIILDGILTEERFILF